MMTREATMNTNNERLHGRPIDGDVRRGVRGHIGWIVAGSLAAGLVAAVLLVAAPFIPPTEAGVTGAVVCGLALGWAMLAVLSLRFTDQPQLWAAAPAAFMGLSGLLLVSVGSKVHEILTWVWPPALLALVIWMLVRVRRQLRSSTRRWLLYPVFALLALASVGGGYQTVRAAMDARAYTMPGQSLVHSLQGVHERGIRLRRPQPTFSEGKQPLRDEEQIRVCLLHLLPGGAFCKQVPVA